MLTPDVLVICYDMDDVLADEIRKKRDMGGNNLLLVSRHCFDKTLKFYLQVSEQV